MILAYETILEKQIVLKLYIPSRTADEKSSAQTLRDTHREKRLNPVSRSAPHKESIINLSESDVTGGVVLLLLYVAANL